MEHFTHCKKAHHDADMIIQFVAESYPDDIERASFDNTMEAMVYGIWNMMLCKHEMKHLSKEGWMDYNREVMGAVYPEDNHNRTLTDTELQNWVNGMYHMVNGQKHMGEHWTIEQTTAVGKQYGLFQDGLTEMEVYAVMNSKWHDHYNSAVLAKMTENPQFFAELAKDFLFDDDSDKTAPERLYCYYKYMR